MLFDVSNYLHFHDGDNCAVITFCSKSEVACALTENEFGQHAPVIDLDLFASPST
jgi:hypothetical protein